MKSEPRLIGLVAGEASGDILGASLMRSLRAIHPDLTFIGVGGPLMEAEGLTSLFPIDRLAVMGIVDVLKQLPDLLSARRDVLDLMLKEQPDIFIGIDAPDFTIPIERRLKEAGMVTVHYVSPSVWAWRQKRVFKIARATNNVLCLLPFEKQFYDRFDVPATFVGHTLADELPLEPDRDAAIARLGVDAGKRYVAILPGSRRTEVGLLAEPFLAAAQILHQRYPDIEFLVPLVNSARREQFVAALDAVPSIKAVTHLFDGQSRDVMAVSEAAMLASGTVALEAMLLKCPMVVAYKFGWLNFQIFSRVVKLEHFSLPNLLAGEALVPELLQDEVNPQQLSDLIDTYLQSSPTTLIERFHSIHRSIRCNAAEAAAQAVLETFQQNRK